MNTGRQYDISLVQRIQKGTRTENIDGVDVELRPVPDDPREHALDPRVDALYQLRKSGAFPTPKNGDLVSLRVRPNKENHEIDGGGVVERVIPMNLGNRVIHLFAFTPKGHKRGTPVLVYFHGGGFTVGNISQFRAPLRYLAERSECVVAYEFEFEFAPLSLTYRFPDIVSGERNG